MKVVYGAYRFLVWSATPNSRVPTGTRSYLSSAINQPDFCLFELGVPEHDKP